MSAVFRAMGTEVTVTTPTLHPAEEAALAAMIQADFEIAERCFSRFRADSELARLNRAEGPIAVSPPLFAALRRARGYHELTDGLFEPTLGGTLEALGYDRSFAPGALDRAEPTPSPVSSRTTFADVKLDAATCTVTRPEGVRFDLGGMIKGHAVDSAARRLPAPSAIDAGGDAVLRGRGPSGEGFGVDVEDPRDPERVLLGLRVRDRAVATSAPNRRRWRVGCAVHHHLVDPRTRRPANTDLLQSTVLAPAAEVADVLAKCAFLLGAREARRFLGRQPGIGAVLVRRDGEVELVGDVEVERDP